MDSVQTFPCSMALSSTGDKTAIVKTSKSTRTRQCISQRWRIAECTDFFLGPSQNDHSNKEKAVHHPLAISDNMQTLLCRVILIVSGTFNTELMFSDPQQHISRIIRVNCPTGMCLIVCWLFPGGWYCVALEKQSGYVRQVQQKRYCNVASYIAISHNVQAFLCTMIRTFSVYGGQ